MTLFERTNRPKPNESIKGEPRMPRLQFRLQSMLGGIGSDLPVGGIAVLVLSF
jgi:hypothetical protein